MSQIYFIQLSRQLIPILQKAGFCSCLLSDHVPYWVTLTPFTSFSTPNWRLNPFWLPILLDTDKLNTELTLFFHLNFSTATPLVVWEAFQKHACLLLTEHISIYKRSSTFTYVQAVAQLTSLDELYVSAPSAESLTRLKLQTRVVALMCYERARHKLFNKQRIFEHGEHPGKSIVYLAHIDSRPLVVITLRSPRHGFITDPKMITRELAIFFQTFIHLRSITLTKLYMFFWMLLPSIN